MNPQDELTDAVKIKYQFYIQLARKYANLKQHGDNLQVVKHVGHVPSVIKGISVGLLSLLHLALVLQDVPQVPPCWQRKEHNRLVEM